MKENLISDKSLIYQWNFNDNSSVVDNPRVKATVNGNPTFKDGVAIFNGSTDYYKLKTLINLGTKYSIEVRFKLNVISDVSIVGYDGPIYGMYIIGNIIYHRAKGLSFDASINWVRDTNWHTYTVCRNDINVTIFFDGILIKTLTNYNLSYCLINSIGATNTGTAQLNGSIEYIKIWNRQLTASEVKNNYTGKTYRALPYKSTTLFHINSDNGIIRDLTGKTVPVATNVALPKIGSNINVMKFNGSSGNINLGSQALLGDITFMGWVNNISRGEGNLGNIINNGQFVFYISNTANNYFTFSRNNNINVISNTINSLKLGNTQFLCITSTSTGITNFYIGNKNNPPTLSGTANQSAGTPVAGTTCYLGNRAEDDRTLNGWLNDVRLDQSILTLEEVTQYWSSTRIKYS